MSDSLWPHGLQHTRLPCPSLSPRVCSDSWSAPNLTRGSFWQVERSGHSEAISLDFSHFVAVKSIGISCTLHGSFNLCTILCHLWKILVHWVCPASKCWLVSFYSLNTPTFVNITMISLEQFLNLGKPSKPIMVYISFLEFQFLFESLSFITGTKYCQLFFLKWQLTAFIFERMSPRYPKLNNYSLPATCFSSENSVSWKTAHDSDSHMGIFLRQPSHLVMPQTGRVHTLHFMTLKTLV